MSDVHGFNPALIPDGLATATQELDRLSKVLASAYDQLDEAEIAWEETFDRVAEALKTEMADEGRKGDPAQHWIVSVSRRENRTAYISYRRAKRNVEKAQRVTEAVSKALSGWQSQSKLAVADGSVSVAGVKAGMR